MKFVADESVDKQIVDRLRNDVHDTLYIAEEKPGVLNDEVLDRAEKKQLLLITANKDFGELVFLQRRVTAGVVLIRLPDLPAHLKVVMPSRVRIRKILN